MIIVAALVKDVRKNFAWIAGHMRFKRIIIPSIRPSLKLAPSLQGHLIENQNLNLNLKRTIILGPVYFVKLFRFTA